MNNKKINPAEVSAGSQHPDYKTEIASIVRSNLTPRLMGEQLLTYHEMDIALALELLRKEERLKLYRVLNPEVLAEILAYSDHLTDYLMELSIPKQVAILSELEPVAAADALQKMDKEHRNSLLDLLEEESKGEILMLNSFHEDEIGSQMTTNYISISSGIGVRQAMRDLVEQAADNDNISTIYVVDDDETLVGAIDLKDLIIAREHTDLAEITMTSYPYVYANEQIEDCIERIKAYSEDSIPVLDRNNKLIGVLTAQDITRLVDEEMSDDYAKLGGLTAEEDLQEPLKKSVRKRLPWLIILLGLGLVVSTVVGLFESVVASLTVVVCFQSLILDMAGNVGTQSLAITIRVLMDEQLTGKQKLALVAKEARVGLCNGLILGSLSFVLIGLYLFLLKGEAITLAFSVSLCTGIALLVSMLLSSITGTIVPIAFKKLNIDPAVASGPLITTINDLVAVVTYYGMSWLLLIQVLGL